MNTSANNSFLWPTTRKLILAAALFFISGWVVWPTIIESQMTDWFPVGFPLVIRAGGYCAGVCVEFRWISLVIDGIVWYLVSALIIRAHIRFWVFCIYFVVGVVGIYLIAISLLALDSFLFFEL